MTDMLGTVIPKSTQLNADDLIGGQSKIIKINKVEIVNGEQPVALHYEGDNGKPYLPCKSMRRILIHCWGGDGSQYVGRSLSLYCDPDVKFGGLSVGGIRISKMSHISKEMTVMLTTTRANRKPFTVKPLVVSDEPNLENWMHDIETAPTLDGLKHKYSEAQKVFAGNTNFAKISAAKDKRKADLASITE